MVVYNRCRSTVQIPFSTSTALLTVYKQLPKPNWDGQYSAADVRRRVQPVVFTRRSFSDTVEWFVAPLWRPTKGAAWTSALRLLGEWIVNWILTPGGEKCLGRGLKAAGARMQLLMDDSCTEPCFAAYSGVSDLRWTP